MGISEIASTKPEPSQEAIRQEQQALLWKTLEAVPARYREVLVLFYRQQQSTAEVAAALNISEATVRKRLERGRKYLRRELAKFVEDTLQETVPGDAFCASVLLLLPAMGAPAVKSAAVVGAGAGAVAKGAGLLTVGMFAGPIIGVLGGMFGWRAGIKNAQSPRERQFVIRYGIVMWLFILGFVAVNLAFTFWGKKAVSGEVYGFALAGLWLIYFLVLTSLILLGERRRQRILKEDGISIVPPKAAKCYPGLTKGAVYGGLGGAVFGSVGWMLGMAIEKADWPCAAVVLVVSALLYIWAVRQTLRNPRQRFTQSVLLILTTGIMLLTAAMVNFRLEAWLTPPQGQTLHLPMLGVNLFLVVLWLGICGTIVLGFQTAFNPQDDPTS